MNNSWVRPDVEEAEILPRLREEEARIVRIVEAIQEISKSGAWSTLKSEVFEGLVATLEKELRAEAKKDDPDPKKLNRLAGELKWAEKFSDLTKLEDSYKLQLQRIRTQENVNSTMGNA